MHEDPRSVLSADLSITSGQEHTVVTLEFSRTTVAVRSMDTMQHPQHLSNRPAGASIQDL